MSLRLRIVVLTSVIALTVACRPGENSATAGSGDGSAAAPTVVEEVGAPVIESAGLVGPGETGVEAIEVVDEGPASPVILFTASLKGYTEPCGCTIDLVLGGIDRVTGFTRAAAALGTASLVLDAGDLLFEYPTLGERERGQELRKARVLVDALRAMGTMATVPGPNDLAAGVAFYLDTLSGADVTILAPNLVFGGSPLGIGHIVTPLGSERIGVVGAVDPALFATNAEVTATDARAAVETELAAARAEGASTTLLLYHGDLTSARSVFSDIEGLDFIVIGHAPRHTDETERIGSATTLEAYDQGRYVGRLKLVSPEGVETPWTSAVEGSNEEAAQLERVIASIEERLAGLTLDPNAEPPPIVVTQRERIAALQAELEAMQQSVATFPPDARTYLWTPTPMDPGLPTNPTVTASMVAYNDELRAINLAATNPPEPPADGQPHYVGIERCATCHVEEYRQWRTMQHAHAMETLETRNKQFDRSCIGCHVTGYEQPGGSTLGHTEGLTDVQCEACHGPGSMHADNPTLRNVPTGVQLQVPESVCVGCHPTEHSPRFDYATYLDRVLGPGHGR